MRPNSLSKRTNPVQLAEPAEYLYLRHWQSGVIIRCRLTRDRADFQLENFLASQVLDYINNFWEPIPNSAVLYVGDPPNPKLRHQQRAYYLQNYLNRLQFQRIEELLKVLTVR
jgi:hypothetical protein